MKKPQYCKTGGRSQAAMIKDGQYRLRTLGMTTMVSSICLKTIQKAIEKRFLETGSPNHLDHCVHYSCGQSDRGQRYTAILLT